MEKRLSAAICDDEAIVLAAVEKNYRAIQFASDRLKNDPKIIETALFANVNAYKYIPLASFEKNKVWVSYLVQRKG